MEVSEIPVGLLKPAPWNPNRMDEGMIVRLRVSIRRYGLVENLVVRPLMDGTLEVLSGNQRLKILEDMGVESVACVVTELDDAEARLLAQALNRIQGDDDLGLKAEVVREILRKVSKDELLKILPETAESLSDLEHLGEMDIAGHLQAWEQAQAARLRHMTFQLVNDQLETINEAMERALAGATQETANPNRRGNALVRICQIYLERTEGE